MNTYLIPREIGDENKFLFFSTKALIFTGAFGAVGVLIYFLLTTIGGMFNLGGEIKVAGVIIALFISAIGYCLGAFKIPDIKIAAFFKNANGEYLDEIVKRVFKFHKNRKIYIYERGDM